MTPEEIDALVEESSERRAAGKVLATRQYLIASNIIERLERLYGADNRAAAAAEATARLTLATYLQEYGVPK